MADKTDDPTSTQPASQETEDSPHHHFHIHLPHPPKSTPPGKHHLHLHVPHPFSKSSPPQPRSGEALLHSDDPSTAPLRAWAEDKEKQYPGQDGSFGTGYTTTMSWGSSSWILPHKGDTPPPPDQKLGIHYHYHLAGVPGEWKPKEEGQGEAGEEKK